MGPLRISDAQFNALAAPFEQAITDWHVERLRQGHPRFVPKNGEALTDFVVKNRAAAQGAGLRREEEIADWMGLLAQFSLIDR